MATLIEEFNLRIEIYGGREVLLRDIQKECSHLFKRSYGHGGSKAHPLWTKEEKKILADGINEITAKLNRSRGAVYNKLLTEGMI